MATIYVAERYAGLRLAEGVEAQGAIQYQAAAQAVKRIEASLAEDPERRRNADPMRRQLSTM